MKNKNAKQNKHTHPGRPKYTPKFPRNREFTFTQFMEANDIETNPDSAKFGKGPNCTMLTLRKFMKRDMFILDGKGKIKRARPNSLLINVRGVTAEPNSESGLGRRANLFALRVNKDSISKPAPKASAPKATKAARKVRTPKVTASTSQTPTADALDKIHEALAAPTPALTVPAVTIAPEATPAPAPAPVAPAPAPEAAPAAAVTPEAAPAPVAAPVATLANS